MEWTLHMVSENDPDYKQQNRRIACVIVAYNNVSNIGKLLEVLLNQSEPIAEIILVDNASSDGTAQMVKQTFPQVTLFANSSNTGVGGGYAQGMEYAYKKGYNWIWLLDGDSLPKVSALEQLMTALVNLMPVHPKIGILASSPTNPSTGQIYGGFIRKGLFHKIPKEITHFRKPVPVDTVVSSGCLVSDKVVKDVGLPRTDFFMDFVDAEYNLRVLRKGYEIISVPNSIIYHHVGHARIITSRIIKSAIRFCFTSENVLSSHPPWREYYAKRNELYTFWHEFRSYRAIFRLMLATSVTILEIVIYNDKQKVQGIKYIFQGLIDGFKGKIGKTVIPPNEQNQNNTCNLKRSEII
ncbi:MAG: Glycosyl transferase family 2 [Candidatus Argoarchaeum ethanivorans]|uniref:Glycosyl transferase family 2 n=1 Tax=Candidatus Argoarchaeum ethanivorans TaxID=2608793 RepID=A0A811T0W6_9EURY|nr:MAG: Glycosyl transferase family 2 [Candidatus Argoarchaeum ethanivorans]